MHIYVVSRLYKKEPTRWESTLRELEQSRAIMSKHYAPLRNAIVSELKNAGSGDKVLRDGIAARDRTGKQQGVLTRSKHALANFIQRIRPKLGALKEHYLGVPTSPSGPFGGAELEGQFHLAATDDTGTRRYLFLHPSAWDGDEVASFIELLAIIGEARHGCSREDVWFLLGARAALTNICGLSYATKSRHGGSVIESASRPVGMARRGPVAVAKKAGHEESQGGLPPYFLPP